MSTERHSRWQQRTVEQLGFNINLFLTLALGGLAFVLSEHTTAPDVCMARYLFFGGTVLLLLASLFGVSASITRLYDFRFTARIIREDDETKKGRLRTATKHLGNVTWFLFWLEIVSFVLGITAIVILTLMKL